MHRRLIVGLLGMLFVLSACGIGPADARQAAIVEATRQYITQNTQVGSVNISVQAVDGDFARVLIDPASDDAESVTAFLKLEGGTWNVLTLGSAFDRETYDEYSIPVSLWV